MENCCIHHIEFGVRDGQQIAETFISLYKFKLIAKRTSSVAKQWVLATGRVRFLLTEITSDNIDEISKDFIINLWFKAEKLKSFLAKGADKDNSIHDSAFNVSVQVNDLERSVNKLVESGVKICKPIHRHKTEEGEVLTATVESCVGNVKHTLVQKSKYSGIFLPGFIPDLNNDLDAKNGFQKDCSLEGLTRMSHVDHITLVSEIGTSSDILSWYEKHFGMARFMINSEEDEKEGFVINGDNIGIRLMAFEYWKCAEVGLSLPSKTQDSIKFVIAEALPSHGPNQVSRFLDQHNGPGIQHIGLHTPDIVQTISVLRENGVKFAEPPCTYYTEVGRLKEINQIGEDVKILRENGILVDMEADAGNDDDTSSSKQRYLMQKFTSPVFDRDTFFLEIIQRLGASGFGSGNITALWRSVQAYMAQKDKPL